jgi:hypothetical protein
MSPSSQTQLGGEAIFEGKCLALLSQYKCGLALQLGILLFSSTTFAVVVIIGFVGELVLAVASIGMRTSATVEIDERSDLSIPTSLVFKVQL